MSRLFQADPVASTVDLSMDLAVAREALRTIRVLVAPGTIISAVMESLAATIMDTCDRALRGERPPTGLCGEYLGDNDGTCPQLTCIRDRGHGGRCDNVKGDTPPHAPVTDDGVVTSVKDDLASLNADMRWHLEQIRQHADHIGSMTIVALVDAALGGELGGQRAASRERGV